jgi:hypothetical protein
MVCLEVGVCFVGLITFFYGFFPLLFLFGFLIICNQNESRELFGK